MVKFNRQSELEQSASGKNMPSRNYFSRPEQYRLIVMVFALMAVLVLMFEAAKPENWAWMWGRAARKDRPVESMEAAEPIDTRLKIQPRKSEIADSFVSLPPQPDHSTSNSTNNTDRDPRVAAAALESIRDDTVFRAAESPVWFDIIEQLRNMSDSQLSSEAAEAVGFVQLFRQPDEYRAHLVRLSGIVRRAHIVNAAKNDHDVDGYWRCWLFTSDSSQNPIVVYVLDMPDDFPSGMSIFERVDFTGVFFKRWAYPAKGGTMTAPLVLAKSGEWTPRPSATVVPQVNWPVIVSVSAMIGLAICWFVYQQSRYTTGNKRRTKQASSTLPPDVVPMLLCVGIGITFLTAQPIRAQDFTREDVPPVQPSDQTTPATETVAAQSREMLRVFQIDPLQLDSLSDGQPFSSSEWPTLWRILNRSPEFPLDRVESWARQSPDLASVAAEPDRYRGIPMGLPIAVNRIGAELVGPPWSDRLPFRRYYQIEATTEDGTFVTVYARVIPKAWQAHVGSEISDSISASFVGLFLKNETNGPAFVTHRVAWHPLRTNTSLGTTTDHVALGRLGFDVGLLDTAKDKTRLRASERECFYALLAATGRATGDHALPPTATVSDVAKLLENPDVLRGNRFTVRGTARRAIKIYVLDSDIRQRFGLDHYYEIEMFVDSARPIRLKVSEIEEEHLRRYPVVICARQIPDNMKLGEDIRVPLEATGFFLKYWAYNSSQLRDVGQQHLDNSPNRFSPMLIGLRPRVLVPTVGGTSVWDIVFGALFVLSLVAIAIYVILGERRNRQRRRQRLPEQAMLPHDDPPTG